VNLVNLKDWEHHVSLDTVDLLILSKRASYPLLEPTSNEIIIITIQLETVLPQEIPTEQKAW